MRHILTTQRKEGPEQLKEINAKNFIYRYVTCSGYKNFDEILYDPGTFDSLTIFGGLV